MNNIENTNTAIQPVQSQYLSVPADNHQNLAAAENYAMVNSAFSKGLAAAIIASLPIGSIIAIFLGNSSLKLVANLRNHAAYNGIKPSGKNIAAKILGMVGKITGIVMTAVWAYYFIFIIFWMILMIPIFSNPENLEAFQEFMLNR